uniref:Putative glycosidase n=1 Tax=Talaromyces marneffei PM1 TaxID=1077442 RepID=A0A093VGB8_TALMA
MRANKHWAASILLAVSVRADFDPLTFVDPLIGTNNGGNVFAGATLPYGMAKPVADVNGQNTGGFATDGSGVTGFSAMHDSGTGGNPSLGNFPIFPQICPDDVIDNCSFLIGSRAVNYDNSSIKASPGYFGLELTNGIAAEMTATQHTALINSTLRMLSPTALGENLLQNATVSVDETSGRIRANGTFLPSFGTGYYESFVCVDFAGGSVNETGIWVNNRAGTVVKDLFVTRGFNLFYLEAGGFVTFDSLSNHTLYARVGVSLVSTEQACQNAETEIPEPTSNFADIQSAAEGVWREKFSPVSVNATGVSDDLQKLFWSGIYRTMLSPQNYTGENPLWSSDEPYFDSYYCIWDAFRVQYPLLTIIDPSAQSQMVRSLVDIYKHEGWLPDCRMSLCKGWTQGGSNADVVLADAYVKNLTGIGWDIAYDAMVNDAENEPLEWSIQGRGGLQSWKSVNYIPYLDFDYLGFGTNSRSISRTVEYAYNDYCVGVVGKGLGKTNATTYLSRSSNWQNIFKADQTSFVNGTNTGFVGFFQPKYLNGTWGFQDPIACSPLTNFCSLTSNPSETFESSVWEYQFYVPHDMKSLISVLGGADQFISRLDYYYESGIADISNDPVFLSVYSYHYAGRPGLSTKRAHSYIPSSFNTSESGLPGNDDSGAMASFSTFSQLGLFPVAGQNVYLISSPFFESVNITHPETKKTATIRVKNFDPTYTDIFIMNATLNGKTYTKNWIGHEFFLEGQILELTVGSNETASTWGKSVDDLPPSLSIAAQRLL